MKTKKENGKILNYKSKLAIYLTMLENTNNDILNFLNGILDDEDCESVREDIQYTLDNDFCKGEQTLRGLLEAFDEIKK